MISNAAAVRIAEIRAQLALVREQRDALLDAADIVAGDIDGYLSGERDGNADGWQALSRRLRAATKGKRLRPKTYSWRGSGANHRQLGANALQCNNHR